jgi:hypothetical protein
MQDELLAYIQANDYLPKTIYALLNSGQKVILNSSQLSVKDTWNMIVLYSLVDAIKDA